MARSKSKYDVYYIYLLYFWWPSMTKSENVHLVSIFDKIFTSFNAGFSKTLKTFRTLCNVSHVLY